MKFRLLVVLMRTKVLMVAVMMIMKAIAITYLPQQLQYWMTMKHGVLGQLRETSLNTHLNVSSYPLSRVPDYQYLVEEHP